MRRRFIPGAVILLYHRAAELSLDPFGLAVSPGHFAQQLEYIQQSCQPMRLDELVNALRQYSLPPRAVAITFDDGYIDNFTQAHPLLEAAQIPWTLFVTSGAINNPRVFWWDELAWLLLSPEHLPDHLQLYIRGQKYEWSMASPQERPSACKAIHRLLQPLTIDERDAALNNLRSWAGLKQTRSFEDRSLSSAELAKLAQSEFVDIGAHTMTHPFLSSLSPEEQQAEIINSRQTLEATLGCAVNTFSYPYGNFTAETPGIVERAEFSAALTVVPSSVEAGDNPFLLGRCEVKNWDIDIFKRRLEKFFVARKIPYEYPQ